MELQGKKATHDFLSLYKDSTFPRLDPTPSQQGFFLKTQDLLQPLEGKRKTAAASEVPGAVAPTSGGASSVEHVLPGGIGTFSISHVPGGFAQHAAAVKPEWGAGANSSGAAISTGSAPYSRGGAFTLWEEPISREKIGTGGGQQLQPQWSSSPYAARISNSGSSFGSLLSTRSQPGQDRRRPMDAASKSGKGFTDEDDDEEEFGRREGSSQKELTVNVDRKSNSDQKATTPRSKHSATEQRRRSKINDRFQILRELIPHSDQKRDKASFLLEVIEYIRFLHEKVQKHETGYSAWGHESTKLTPWKNSLVPVEGIPDPSQALHNGPSPSGFVFSGDSAIPVAPVMLTSDHTPLESENLSTGLANKGASIPASLQQYSSGRGFVQPQQRLISDSENVASQSQSQWSRQCSGSGGDILSEQELTIDEGTISISSAYSQGLLNALTEALQNSGIDLSQASISVQINLGKRAFSRSVSNPKDQGDPSSGNQAIGHSQMGSTVEEPEQANKRHKPDKS